MEALGIRARELGLSVDPDMVFRDDGFSGSRLDRPALDSLRDAVAEGRFRILLVYDADRLARNFVHQEILLEELERFEVAVEFVENPPSRDPEGRLLSQVKGIFAEYERTKIMERTRRGKLHRAKYQGWLNWSTVPYGYSLVRMPEGTRVQINKEEADWLDDTVRNAMKSWIMEPETLRAELNSVLSIPEQWDSIERQWSDLSSLIRGYEGQISRITDAYQSGAIELDDLKKRRDMLVAKIYDAVKRRDEIAALRQREISMENILSDVESFAVTIRNRLETLTFQEKRKLIELLVERVIVKGNNVTVENVVPLKGRFSVLCKDGRGSSQGTEAGRAKAPLPEDA